MSRDANLTAAQEILLAADDLRREGDTPFSEWDLTVAAWKRNKNRFGCRGYEEDYPDHKRVMMEIMSRKKKDNPLRRGFLTKVRTNYYDITSLGESEASRLRRVSDRDSTESVRASGPIYDAVKRYAEHDSFESWLEDPEEPRTWLGAAAFFNLAQNTPMELQDRLRAARNSVNQAIEWCEENNKNVLTRGPHGGGKIPYDKLNKLDEFIDVLEERFKRQMDAIRKKD